MRQTLLLVIMLLSPAYALAAGGEAMFPHDSVRVDTTNMERLRNGARLYANYCMSCHSLKYMSYKQLADDLDLNETQTLTNFVYHSEGKLGDYMKLSFPDDAAGEWFGRVPPDLSLVARSRGPKWVYNYLRAFYVDETRPFGVNNSVLRNASMPHVLWELEGLKHAKFEAETAEDGTETQALVGFEEPVGGELTPKEYDAAVRDIVTFLDYVGEPAKLKRESIGGWVIFFLLILLGLSYLLKKEFWRDVH